MTNKLFYVVALVVSTPGQRRASVNVAGMYVKSGDSAASTENAFSQELISRTEPRWDAEGLLQEGDPPVETKQLNWLCRWS